jgi:uncharacterized damage-inducible protein DinB
MKTYRKGPIGALADEYEKALLEYKTVLQTIDEQKFNEINNEILDNDLISIKNISLHIVKSGFVYANYIRNRFGNQCQNIEIDINTVAEAIANIDRMFAYTLETFEDKYHLTDDDLMQTIIKTSWTTYDLEAIIEHAIVHILRHRLQIEKRLQ